MRSGIWFRCKILDLFQTLRPRQIEKPIFRFSTRFVLVLAPKKSEEPANQNLERVSRALKSENPKLVNKAFRYIVQYRLKDFLPKMQKQADQSGSSYQKGLVIRLMLSLGGDVYFREIAAFLHDDDPRIISTAIEALELIGNTQALGYITQFVTHEHNRVQATAMKALYNLGDQGALRLFLKLIASPHVAYRNSAAYALKEMHIPASIPLLEKLYQDEDESVREKAREGLVYLADEGSSKAKNILIDQPEKQELETTTGERTSEDWIESIRHALESQDKQSLEIFLTRLKGSNGESEKDEKVMASLIMGIGRLGGQKQAPVLQPYLQHPNTRIRANAVEALGLLLPAGKRKCLLPCFEDQNNRVIGNTILTLIHDFDPEACTALSEIAQSSNMLDQLTAVYCIGALGEERNLQLSEYLLESAYTEVREKMIRVLEALGEDSHRAVKLLEEWKLKMLSFADETEKQKAEEPVEASSEQAWHPFSLTLFLTILSLEVLLNLLGLSFGDRIRFLQSTVSLLRSACLYDGVFQTVTHLALPLSALYFFVKNKAQIQDFPLISGLILGLSLHQHVQFLDTAGARFGPDLNFLAHFASRHYEANYAGNPFIAMQILNLPLLLLPLGIEGWFRYGNARIAMGTLILCTGLAGTWISVLDQKTGQKLQYEKMRKLRANLQTRQAEMKTLLTQNRLDRLANLALRDKTNSSKGQNSLDGRRVRLRFEARRLRTQLKNLEKRLKKLDEKIEVVDWRVGNLVDIHEGETAAFVEHL